MSPRALVVGGGYAGVAAATALAEAGWGVDLLESRGFLGGRVYSIVNDRFPLPVDNGPHLLMGCYREAFRLFDRLGLKDGFHRVDPLALRWISPGGGAVSLQCPPLPAPFHLIAGILASDAFPGTEKWKLMASLAPFAVRPFPLPRRARTVSDWMRLTRQGTVTRERFWVPLCRAVMNVPPEIAPLRGLGEVLRRVFFGSRKDSALVVPKRPLSEIAFPQVPGYLRARGGEVHLREGARSLRLASGPFQVGTVTGKTFTADALVLALPPRSLEALWNSSGLPSPAQEARLGRSPILSVHLIVEKKVVEGQMVGLPGAAFDWVFNRDANWGYAGPGQYLSLVSSADPDLAARPEKEVVVRAWEEMQARFPALAGTQPLHAKVTREMAATFFWDEAAGAARLPAATAFPNVFLAGDWTATGLPATIEGACLSGHRAAAGLLGRRS
ncbi:MAG TPA: hydroxysqualene dehydroxylase HpnE [bacterium]|nr:hydroxysqualene dehydroxylase HpnE [bacterium]